MCYCVALHVRSERSMSEFQCTTVPLTTTARTLAKQARTRYEISRSSVTYCLRTAATDGLTTEGRGLDVLSRALGPCVSYHYQGIEMTQMTVFTYTAVTPIGSVVLLIRSFFGCAIRLSWSVSRARLWVMFSPPTYHDVHRLTFGCAVGKKW